MNNITTTLNPEVLNDCYELVGRIESPIWDVGLSAEGYIIMTLKEKNAQNEVLDITFQGKGIVRIRVLKSNGSIKSTRTYDAKWNWMNRDTFADEIKSYGESDGFIVPDFNYVSIMINDQRRDVDSLIDKIHEFNENE